MSSVPFSGVMNPWPWERENCLQTPLKMGPAEARAVLREERQREVPPVALTREAAWGEVCYNTGLLWKCVIPWERARQPPAATGQVGAVMPGAVMATCTRYNGFFGRSW